ncbi:hypothetical protein VPH35_031840 [Triticum aestivum]|uniref:F-box domain-containing protein n=1 Tax=Triticum turgidum subsp. durum TaxID=4567 RepID=A0A9R1PZC3_TRITD|nr:FBD-associated F-box protein At5g60610-like [Triticum aestivum]VAH52576.1 unnamed protein product [Triticum turgidum subsp. durum]
MASPSRKKPSSSSSGRRDRISDLPDDLLGHVLSFLPTKEAGRAAMLGRRWRDIFCSVHTISSEEREGQRAGDWDTYFYEAQERRSCSTALLQSISAALLHRRRRPGLMVPLRSFRFAFDSYHGWDKGAVDQWLFEVLRQRTQDQELHLDLRFFIGPICARGSVNGDDEEKESNDNKSWGHVLPRTLFSCRAVRTMCLSYCKLNLPEVVDLPFLETLRLTSIRGDSEETIQKLIWSCPRLADLTLEANNRLKKLTVLDKRLRRFALRCCHNVTQVSIDASTLRCLEYSGSVPEESLMSLRGSPAVSSCTIRFCKVRSNESEFVRFRKLLEIVSDSKHLHLHHRGLGSEFFTVSPLFANLTRLELQGPIENSDTVDTVKRILEQTPNLEVLSLYMEERQQDVEKRRRREEKIRYRQLYGRVVGDDQEEYDRSVDLCNLRVPDSSCFSLPCLRRRLKEINMVNYQCDVQHRVLASLLFRNALVLERMCVVFVKGLFAVQVELRKEIESWVVAKPDKSFM